MPQSTTLPEVIANSITTMTSIGLFFKHPDSSFDSTTHHDNIIRFVFETVSHIKSNKYINQSTHYFAAVRPENAQYSTVLVGGNKHDCVAMRGRTLGACRKRAGPDIYDQKNESIDISGNYA